MTGKTKKEFQAENLELREKLKMVEYNFENLSDEHKTLQTNFIIEKEKRNMCNNCEKNLDRSNNFEKHKNRSSMGVFKCEQCKKEFDQEWKKRAHEKKHKKYQCDKCDECFEYQDIMKKHKLVSHENTKLYCHFFNNDKSCPYDDRCIFLHEDSRVCKYDLNCERDYCMFKHRKKEELHENIELFDEVIDIIEVESDSDEIEEDIENDRSELNVNDSINKTFQNPSQESTPSGKKFNCEKCDFEATTKSDLVSHKKENHNWCPLCFSNFNSQDKLKDHIQNNHTE